jgi:hypothetical protein
MNEGTGIGEIGRNYGQEFDCATLLHKARRLPKDHCRQ